MKKNSRSISLLILVLSIGNAYAETNIGQIKCSEYVGTEKTEKQLKTDMKSGKHDVSAANSLGKMLGNRLRQKSYETWVAGYLAGHAHAVGQTTTAYTVDKIKSGLQDYCINHADSLLLEASKSLAQKSQ
jgi:hypothetical protein